MIRRQAADWLSASGRPRSARACPWVISFAADGVEDLGGQVEQADQVGDGRSIDAQPAGELFLGAAVAREVFAEGAGLVDGVQILALEVFDHRQLEDALIVEHQDPRGHFVKLGLDAGAQPALAGDQLVAQAHGSLTRTGWSMPCWRSESASEAISLALKLAARLERVGVDLIDGDLDQLGLFERAGLKSAFFATQQCFESASETSLIHGR